jgi:hypothetical protein
MTALVNSILVQDPNAPYSNRTVDVNDSLELDVSELTLNYQLRVKGNMIVEGTTVVHEQEVSRYADAHLYLNTGYETVSAQTGGLVINYLPIATSDTVAAGGFVAGVPATSNPTVATTGAATFAVGQFIQISGAKNETNDGIFEVLSHAANVLTIRGVGTTATVEDFTQNQFVTETTVQGTIKRVNLSVIRAGVDGIWETGIGSTTPLTFADLSSSTSTTLQAAYDNDVNGGDATITTNATDGAVVIAGDQKLKITATDGLDVDTKADFDVTQFDVDVTGAGYSLDANTASNVSVTGGNLTLSTITSGGVLIVSAGNSTYTVPNASAAALGITDGTLTYLRVDSTIDSLELPTFVTVEGSNAGGKGAGVQLVTDVVLALGEVCYIKANGNVAKADADTGSLREATGFLVSTGSFGAAATALLGSIPGTLEAVLFSAAPSAADNGKLVYLSIVAGQGSLSPPAVGGNRVRAILGVLQGADGVTTTPLVLWMPVIESRGPSVGA